MPGFDDIGSLEKIALPRLNGWGHGSYLDKGQFRADLLIIRNQVGLLFGAARKSVEAAEREYRREHLPPPSREKPRQDPAAVAAAQSLERLAKAIGALQVALHNQPVPGTDKSNDRYRQDAATLKSLMEAEQMLTGQAELLRTTVESRAGAWLIENLADVQEGVAAITETLRQRQLLLLPA